MSSSDRVGGHSSQTHPTCEEEKAVKQMVLDEVRIVELRKGETAGAKLDYRYVTTHYYDLEIARDGEGWRIGLRLRSYETPAEKGFVGTLFEEHVNEPRVFAAVLRRDQVGWIELGYDKWNNRMRVWEFLVKEGFRRRGIGELLMRFATKVAQKRGTRMLVLETQSCNVPAIKFYLAQGFSLIGLDSAAYSNEDVAKEEVRLEMGRLLDGPSEGQKVARAKA